MTIGSKEEVLKRIGVALREHRLMLNLPQSVVASRSGVSLTAVKHLENGEGATLGTFVLVCRTLNQDHWISALEPKDAISPIAYADAIKKAATKKRRRANSSSGAWRST